jgi:hypothetical protein
VVNRHKEPFDLYIGRGTLWGNPFKIGVDGTREEVIDKYRRYVLNSPEILSRLCELKGKKLGCSCKPYKCHGDVLVELIQQFCLENF